MSGVKAAQVSLGQVLMSLATWRARELKLSFVATARFQNISKSQNANILVSFLSPVAAFCEDTLSLKGRWRARGRGGGDWGLVMEGGGGKSHWSLWSRTSFPRFFSPSLTEVKVEYKHLETNCDATRSPPPPPPSPLPPNLAFWYLMETLDHAISVWLHFFNLSARWLFVGLLLGSGGSLSKPVELAHWLSFSLGFCYIQCYQDPLSF